MQKTHQMKNIKKKAYKGLSGARRKQFCDEYRRVLPQIYSNLYNGYIKTLKEGEQISCKKGCFHCCYQHVGLFLAHGILIVDYLYSHDVVLNNFLNNYPQWKESAWDISLKLDAELNSAMQERNPAAILRHANNPLSSSYFDIQVPCPFLLNSCCSIYEVRPLNCAGHYSTSPCEWCSENSPKEPKIEEALPSDSDMIKLFSLPYFTPNLLLHLSTMPIMVYELLVDGLPAFLSKFRLGSVFM